MRDEYKGYEYKGSKLDTGMRMSLVLLLAENDFLCISAKDVGVND